MSVATLCGALVLAGCATDPAGSDEPSGTDTTADEAPATVSPAPDDTLLVAASFYALQYAAERVGGDLVDVFSITPPGVDPHDVELSPRQVRELGDADAVIMLSGFQPPVDEAVEARAPAHLLDVLDTARLVPPGGDGDDDGAHHDHDHDDGHVGHDHDDGHDHGALGGLDPHFWLDPARMVDVGHAIARLLADVAPQHADDFAAGAADLEADLTALDTRYRDGLATCERDVVITGHTAFGYLARAYGFTEVGIAGIDPESEPSPARLREVRASIEQYDATTLYAAPFGSDAVPATLAELLDLELAHLDPVEVQVDTEADYLDVMRTNLDELRTGLGCR